MVNAIDACDANDSTNSTTSFEYEIISPEISSFGFNNWRTPITESLWFFNGTLRNDFEW